VQVYLYAIDHNLCILRQDLGDWGTAEKCRTGLSAYIKDARVFAASGDPDN